MKSDNDKALEEIQEAVREGRVGFGEDHVSASLDFEIQVIYAAIHEALRGTGPRRKLWVADGTSIGFVLPWDDQGHVDDQGRAALAKASETLGIPLDTKDLWTDAAMRLRTKTATKS